MSEEIKEEQVVATNEVPLAEGEDHVNEEPKVTEEINAEIERLRLKKAELDKQAQEAEEKALYWRKEKSKERDEYFKGRRAEKEPAPQPTETTARPNRDDFDDYDKYVEALTDWKVTERERAWKEETSKKQQQSVMEEKVQEFTTKLDKGYEAYPDFEEVVKSPDVPFSQLMRDILMETENPADVAYYLGKNRLELIKINRMTPFKAYEEVRRIEADLKKNPINKPVKQVSDAPKPIKPVGGSEKVEKDVSKMSQKEYEQWAKERKMRQF